MYVFGFAGRKIDLFFSSFPQRYKNFMKKFSNSTKKNIFTPFGFFNQIWQYIKFTWKLHGNHADLRLHLRQFATLFQTWEKRVNRTQYTLWKPHLWGFEFRLGENSEKKKEIIYFLLTCASNVTLYSLRKPHYRPHYQNGSSMYTVQLGNRYRVRHKS